MRSLARTITQLFVCSQSFAMRSDTGATLSAPPGDAREFAECLMLLMLDIATKQTTSI
jgi:hypothetical protein